MAKRKSAAVDVAPESGIYYSPLCKRHIDLAKILCISDPYFVDAMGAGGWYIGFDIAFKGNTGPARFVVALVANDEVKFVKTTPTKDFPYAVMTHHLAVINEDQSVGWVPFIHGREADWLQYRIVGLERVQEELKELIAIWQNFKLTCDASIPFHIEDDACQQT